MFNMSPLLDSILQLDTDYFYYAAHPVNPHWLLILIRICGNEYTDVP